MQRDVTLFGYLEEVLGYRASTNPKGFENCLSVMKSFEEKGDEWWLNSNPIEKAIRQVEVPVLLIPFDVLKLSFTKVLGRAIEDAELTFSNKGLISEFKEKAATYTDTVAGNC